MKLKSRIMFAQMENETVGLPMGDTAGKFSGLIKVNDTAKEIIDLLQQERTLGQLVDKMAESYDAPKDVLRKDVEDILRVLDENGLLEK